MILMELAESEEQGGKGDDDDDSSGSDSNDEYDEDDDDDESEGGKGEAISVESRAVTLSDCGDDVVSYVLGSFGAHRSRALFEEYFESIESTLL